MSRVVPIPILVSGIGADTTMCTCNCSHQINPIHTYPIPLDGSMTSPAAASESNSQAGQ